MWSLKIVPVSQASLNLFCLPDVVEAADTADSHVTHRQGPDPQGVCGCVFGNTCSLRALRAAW